MLKRYILFFALSALVIVCNFAALWWMQKNRPPAPPKKPAQVAAKEAVKKAEKTPQAGQEKAEADKQKAEADKQKAEAQKHERQAEKDGPAPAEPARKEPELVFATLGSADPDDPYRMLATITSRGAAVQRIELNSPRFHDLEDRSGYIGHLEGARPPDKAGYLVRVVGDATPAARAGLKPGDVVTAVDDDTVIAVRQFGDLLQRHKPGDSVTLTVDRAGKKKTLNAKLARRPLEVVKPEGSDPLSFLLTLNQIGDKTLAAGDEELPGLRLRTSNWTVLPRDPAKPDEVSFEYLLDKEQLRVVKTYSIARLTPEQQDDLHAPAYHLNLRVEVENLGQKGKKVAYRLDGPTGLPIEGWWYSLNTKIGQSGSPGIRDLAIGRILNKRFQYDQVNAVRFAEDELPKPYTEVDLVYAGVDAQYVAAMLIPKVPGDASVRFKELLPLRVGRVPADKYKKKLVDVSCRLISDVATLEPEKPLAQEFQIFAGPKRPDLLDQYVRPYGLGDLVYYGWFGWVSRPMLAILHFFYGVVGNYGLAIIMLTVLVRSGMFPLSRKQALNAAKMQELQPELKKLADKYKNPEERMRAQREFFRKHDYHPLSGCLPALVQLPIFLGLYRSLAVDIELRQAPLISESVRWCSNLGAPDMLWYWKPYLPIDMLTDEAAGWLGPYLNVLPLLTIALFIVQQKMFLPPPTDEQAAMQQKMMQWMMIFMGVMFFKVASGLCLYFIASSLWGIAERKLLPKPAPQSGGTAGGESAARLSSPPGSNGSGKTSSRKSKQRYRK
ncbi:MAG TPA: YidC/Oxa1 family insertase periplasmic-domain containing protein [Pirellulales bacterium]|nr:YidC/Oxa1 family insertase periplasmic-domain containing protein [Pirellulales bacterium]